MTKKNNHYSLAEYLRVPSKAPYAWLVYFLMPNVISLIRHYSPQDLKFMLTLLSYFFTVISIIQIGSNALNFIRNKQRINITKVVIITLIIIFVVVVTRTLEASGCPRGSEAELQKCFYDSIFAID